MPTGRNCVECPHRCNGQQLTTFDGTGQNKVLILGGFPSKYDKAKPYTGTPGYYLDRFLRRSGASREAFLISNAGIWCQPTPTKDWHKTNAAAEAMNHCRPHWEGLIEQFKPKVIVTLGEIAFAQVTGIHGPLKLHHSYVYQTNLHLHRLPMAVAT